MIINEKNAGWMFGTALPMLVALMAT
ncbi:MAG: hypothetical protein JWR49_3323, partial [Tardiphaga sp.]|nr:hypothetical protein [Tardiphaga sp.]